MSLHIGAKKIEIAKTVLLPGDPKRAEFIAGEFLTEVKQYSDIRHMKGFTGKYQGKKVSIQTTGMGMPSMGIISYELIKDYKVKNLIRIGTCGSFDEKINISDLIMINGAATDSNYQHSFELNGNLSAVPDFYLLEKAVNIARERKIKFNVGQIVTCDVFYEHNTNWWKKWKEVGILGVEMETAALYYNALVYGAKAFSMVTVSDDFIHEKRASIEKREKSFTEMIEIALNIAE
ncbi:MAG: purine-nucleoside phosphorylase [Clostridiales Family XIII bacterium]|jgi:purine-nucleoside phosphorylase|nr:purine-nucleoside phosphorylase [Clostridiales Family XIII bacterium]